MGQVLHVGLEYLSAGNSLDLGVDVGDFRQLVFVYYL